MARVEAHSAATNTLAVTVAFSPRAGVIDEVALNLPASATVADALRASALASRYPGVAWADVPVGVWSRPCTRATRLRDGDRVEIYRPLVVDPKEARRLRHSSQLATGKRAGR